MRTATAIIASVALGIALTAHSAAARADGWSVAIGVGLPGVVVVPATPAYGPPPVYYVPAYPPDYAPPPYYGDYRRGYYHGEHGRYYGPPVSTRGDDDDDDD